MRTRLILSLSLLSCCIAATPAFAQDTTTEAPPAKGSITIEQVSPNNMLGTWTLVRPGSETFSGATLKRTFENLEPGRYTLLLRSPDGAEEQIIVTENGTRIQTYDVGQANVELKAGAHLIFTINYQFTQIGVVTVTSDPKGLGFTIRGPNNYTHTDVTPWSYLDAPEGLYSVTYTELEGCRKPAPQSHILPKDSRASFKIELQCAAADAMREQEAKDREIHGSLPQPQETNGYTFGDVDRREWFAPYVDAIVAWKIMTGYNDETGLPLNRFGPSNSLTLGELAKIAHRMAGVDEFEKNTLLVHTSATGSWYGNFVGSAEQRGWIVYLDPAADMDRPATRGEVVTTILQALNVPAGWPKGTVFADVAAHIAHAGAIETAAADGIIAGYANESGELTGMFGPNDPVKRAEITKIIFHALKKYREI